MEALPMDSQLAATGPYPMGLKVASAEGIFLTDESGKQYMDLISGVAVANLGHRHPVVTKAIIDQAQNYGHVMVYGEYHQPPQARLAKRLAEVMPDPLDTLYLVNSGTEANEAALKLAKRYTGRSQLIAFRGSYHGSTHGSLSVTGNEEKKYAFRPLLPDVQFITFNQEADLDVITDRTAAVIMEVVQGDAGVRIPSKEYLQKLRRKCDETGTLIIADEIQTGFGRCGSFFVFEQFDFTPDIVTMAKAMGGGLPLGGLMASKELLSAFTTNPYLGHITTFGGNPISCAASLATLNTLISEDLPSKALDKGRLFEARLKHPLILEIRQIGLMMAVDLPSEELVDTMVQKCLKKGLILFRFLSCPSSFRISPPLVIEPDQIEAACSLMLEVLNEISD